MSCASSSPESQTNQCTAALQNATNHSSGIPSCHPSAQNPLRSQTVFGLSTIQSRVAGRGLRQLRPQTSTSCAALNRPHGHAHSTPALKRTAHWPSCGACNRGRQTGASPRDAGDAATQVASSLRSLVGSSSSCSSESNINWSSPLSCA